MESKNVSISVGEWEFGDGGRAAAAATTATGLAGAMRNGNHAARINQIAPTQVEPAANVNKPPSGNLASKIAKLLFTAHLFAIAIFVTFLALRGFLSDNKSFNPFHWYLPLLTSTTYSAVLALTWLLITLRHPCQSLKLAFWLGPLLACATGVLLLATGTAYGLAIATVFLATALTVSLYACWVMPRRDHAKQILSASIPAVPHSAKVLKLVAIGLAAGVAYAWFWTLGVGGLAANGSRFAALYVLILLLSLAWTMHVIRYVTLVAVSRIAYMRLAHGKEIDACQAFGDAACLSFGHICLGSAMAPAIVAFRGLARAMDLLAGDSDEFLFSCASCYMGVADQLVACGNRWGFVHVGVHDKGFVRASGDVWEMFAMQGMRRLIDINLTGSFCFLCGVAGGGLSAMTAGWWVLAVDKGHSPAVTACAFVIGYFLHRILTAWPQACVAACHVAYAENPQNPRIGSVIADRIHELQSSPA